MVRGCCDGLVLDDLWRRGEVVEDEKWWYEVVR